MTRNLFSMNIKAIPAKKKKKRASERARERGGENGRPTVDFSEPHGVLTD